MIGQLPKSLSINGIDYNIRSDYRVALVILQALNDVDLTDYDKSVIIIECLYGQSANIPDEDIQEAIDKAGWFLNCGHEQEHHVASARVYDWEQDEQIIFSAINKVAGHEVRADEYMHWWTFMGLFNEIGEGTFQTIVSLRDKQNRHKKLEKWERDYIRKNPDIVKLKRKYSESEKAENELVEMILKGGS